MEVNLATTLRGWDEVRLLQQLNRFYHHGHRERAAVHKGSEMLDLLFREPPRQHQALAQFRLQARNKQNTPIKDNGQCIADMLTGERFECLLSLLSNPDLKLPLRAECGFA